MFFLLCILQILHLCIKTNLWMFHLECVLLFQAYFSICVLRLSVSYPKSDVLVFYCSPPLPPSPGRSPLVYRGPGRYRTCRIVATLARKTLPQLVPLWNCKWLPALTYPRHTEMDSSYSLKSKTWCNHFSIVCVCLPPFDNSNIWCFCLFVHFDIVCPAPLTFL